MPVTLECCQDRLHLDKDVARFVIPLGATVNMDGTALYQGVAAMFIAQTMGLDLSLMDQITIVLTATLASIGTAGVWRWTDHAGHRSWKVLDCLLKR